MHLIIGSRGSDLALYQANLIKTYLARLGFDSEIKIIKTTGDKIDTLSFDQMEGKNFFTKELEEALLSREIDLAVHSLKDLSTQFPEGLKAGAYCNPEDPSELLLVRPDKYDPEQKFPVKHGSTIGTSSVRRQAQIAYYRPDLKIEPLRGNVPTRVRKLQDGKFDAILIARAGVERLKLDTGDLKYYPLDRMEFIPAPGQGILAIEIRANDPEIENMISRLNEDGAELTAVLERGLLTRFEGGCQLPLAVTSVRRNNGFFLKAFLGVRDGDRWGKPALFADYGEDVGVLIEKAYLSLSRAAKENRNPVKKKVLITRNEDEGAEFFRSFDGRAQIIYYPVFQIQPAYNESLVDDIISRFEEFDWIIFTSKNTVRIFKNILDKLSLELNPRIKIAAVGGKTAELLERSDIRVDFTPQREDSAGLIEEWPKSFGKETVKIFLPQGEEAPDHLEKGLTAAGHQVTRVNLYKTLPTPRESLPRIDWQSIDFFVFTSPLSVKFYFQLGNDLPAKAWVSSIGRPTTEALAEHNRQTDYMPAKADLYDIAVKIRERL